MFDWQDFDEVFSFNTRCSYTAVACQKIGNCRGELEGLFVDKVLKLLGIKRPVKFYPPRTHDDLKTLHTAVVESSAADHHKISVLYYVLLDLNALAAGRDISTEFERKSALPKSYRTYMQGLWQLDHLNFKASLQYLTYPSLIPTFADEILIVLVRHSKNNDFTLPLAYYYSVQPALTQQAAIEGLQSAIARSNVTEAFYYGRSLPEQSQRHMFEMLIALALTSSATTSTADRGIELVNLPMTPQEEDWFEEYLLRGEGRTLHEGKATLMMRKIGTGKFKEASAIRGVGGRAIGGLDWSALSEGARRGLES